jgi:hypothetical protein
MTREEALQLPGVEKSQHVLVSTAARMIPVAYPEAEILKNVLDPSHVPEPAASQPSFLMRRDTGEAPELRMWMTMDNLFFHGAALWLIERDSTGWPLSAKWVPFPDWSVDQDTGVVSAYDQPVTDPRRYIMFTIPDWSGLLVQASRTLRGVRDTERAWTARMRAPVQLVNFEVTDANQADQQDIDQYISAWKNKRHNGGQAVGATPPGYKMNVFTGAIGDADLFLNARNTNRNDIASHASLDGSMADGSGGQDSLTYQTQVGIRSDFYEFDSAFWTIPISARLSLNDIVPRGTQIVFRYMPTSAPDATRDAPTQHEITQSTTESSTTEGDDGQEQQAPA